VSLQLTRDHRNPRRVWLLYLAAPLPLMVVLGAIWATTPDGLHGLLMLVGGVLTAVAYVVGYVIERRVHWRS
jgi:uncharacterized RDD family membrane protein YckC